MDPETKRKIDELEKRLAMLEKALKVEGDKVTVRGSRIVVESQSALELTSQGDTTVKGINGDVNADVSLKANGTASMDLTAGGSLTARAALIRRN